MNRVFIIDIYDIIKRTLFVTYLYYFYFMFCCLDLKLLYMCEWPKDLWKIMTQAFVMDEGHYLSKAGGLSTYTALPNLTDLV